MADAVKAGGPKWRRWVQTYRAADGKGVLVCEGAELLGADGQGSGIAVQSFYTWVDPERAFDPAFLEVGHRAGKWQVIYTPTGDTVSRHGFRTGKDARAYAVAVAGAFDWRTFGPKTKRAAYDAICAAGLR